MRTPAALPEWLAPRVSGATKPLPGNLAEEAAQTQVRVSGDRAPAGRDLADVLRRNAVAAAAERVTRSEQRPVLIGTRSVQASEELSRVLTARGLGHALLNAKQDRDEAEIVAAVGNGTTITVATNMAGRGTDIRLGPHVAERGGLHIILTEYHESARIDRQLFGRCARQGDPGDCQAIVSLEDELFRVYAPWLTRLAARLGGEERARWLLAMLRIAAQTAAEWRNKGIRRDTLRHDRRLERTLAFSGRQG